MALFVLWLGSPDPESPLIPRFLSYSVISGLDHSWSLLTVYWLSLCPPRMRAKSLQSCPTLCNPMTLARQAPLSMGILQARILEWVARPPPGDLPNPGIEPRSPTFQADSLPSKPTGRPMNTGVGSLQGLFLHCRRILHQLSYPGSPLSHLGSPVYNFTTSTYPFICSWTFSYSG